MPRKTDEFNILNSSIGEKILELRIAKGLSRQQLASKIEVTHQQLQKYEKGTNRICPARLFRTSQVLGESISYFFEAQSFDISERTRIILEISRNCSKIKNNKVLDTICSHVSALSENL